MPIGVLVETKGDVLQGFIQNKPMPLASVEDKVGRLLTVNVEALYPVISLGTFPSNLMHGGQCFLGNYSEATDGFPLFAHNATLNLGEI